jgi:hypothetical protein
VVQRIGVVSLALTIGGCGHAYHRQASNSAMTLAMFDNLFEALALFAEHCGGYPDTLAPLETPTEGVAPGCARLGAFADAVRAEGLFKEGDDIGMFARSVDELPKVRETGVHHEYRFQYVPGDKQANGLYRTYVLSADPVKREETGFFSFWMSERGDIHRNESSGAGPGDPLYRTASRRRPTKG